MNTTIFIVCFLLSLLSFILGMVHARGIRTKKPDGIFYINLTNPTEESMKLQIDVPIEELPKQKYLIFKIKKTQ